ncbi:MAG: hypothetical protein M1817_001481 [Caeruleum heppii]|nr:MAG: hypothetical protein M1817_001481 [Caeruleum heppii]
MADRQGGTHAQKAKGKGKGRGRRSHGEGSGRSDSTARGTEAAPSPRTSTMSSYGTSMRPTLGLSSRTESHQSGGPKIAIPRLPRDVEYLGSSSREAMDKNRVSHACEPCRSRKTKCTGERPTCNHCRDHSLTCVYADGKRDRARKEMGSLQERVEDYEQLLRQLSINGDSATQLAIQKALDKNIHDDSDDHRSVSTYSRKRRPAPQDEADPGEETDPGGENLVSADVGSTGSLDRVSEDMSHEDRAATFGYYGKASDIAWIKRTMIAIERYEVPPLGSTEVAPPPEGVTQGTTDDHRRKQTQDATYHMDDLDLSPPAQADQTTMPPKPVADAFVNAYFTTTHPSFPLLSRLDFFDKYNKTYEAYGHPMSRRWRATLNLVFAIGAKFCVLTSSECCDERDHQVFFARARSLSLDDGAVWHTSQIEQVQVTGLAVLYLVVTDHINRAWFFSGVAVRYAQGLGFHLRNDSKSLDNVQKEKMIRVWWAIYSLERLLGVMTGRPSAIVDSEVSTPLPVPIVEESFPDDSDQLYENFPVNARTERWRSPSKDALSPDMASQASQSHSNTSSLQDSQQRKSTSLTTSRSSPSDAAFTYPVAQMAPNPATYFIYRTQLAVFIHRIQGALYTAGTIYHSWANAQRIVRELDQKLETWQTRLPSAYDFTKKPRDQACARERLSLGMLYWSAKILVSRPCLCRLDGNQIPHESAASQTFNRRMALSCIFSAGEMIKLIPDEPNPQGLYHAAPWWSILHHLTQAGIVILLELSDKAPHMPNEIPRLLGTVKKVVLWFRAMAERSVAAQRAWKLMDQLVRRMAFQLGADTSEMPQVSPGPSLASSLEPTASFGPSATNPQPLWLWYSPNDGDELLQDLELSFMGSPSMPYEQNPAYVRNYQPPPDSSFHFPGPFRQAETSQGTVPGSFGQTYPPTHLMFPSPLELERMAADAAEEDPSPQRYDQGTGRHAQRY